MKMQKTDIGVVVFMYAVCGFFYAYSAKLSDTSRTYPKFTIALLFFLTTFYLVQMILNARRFGVESGVDTVFAGFKPVQFLVTLAMVIVYFFYEIHRLLRFDNGVHARVPSFPACAHSGHDPFDRIDRPSHLPCVRSLPRRAASRRHSVLRR